MPIELSVVIPVYNSTRYIETTLNSLAEAINEADISQYEIIIVDDGSTDGLGEVIESMDLAHVQYHRQQNLGRIFARLNGLRMARYHYALLIDSRVIIQKNALNNVIADLRNDTDLVISGPCRFPENSSLLELFWDSVTKFVWFRYHQNPRKVQLTSVNFNSFPKGTTCLIVPVEVMIAETEAVLRENSKTIEFINDDTLILRKVCEKTSYWIDPDLDAVYVPRSKFFAFLRHSYHRGKVFVSGFLGGWIKVKLLAVAGLLFLLLGITLWASILFTNYLLIFCFAIAIFLTKLARIRKLSWRNVTSLSVYGIPFITSYLSGIIIGLIRTARGK